MLASAFPSDTINLLTSIGAALLAVSVTVFAIVPLMVDVAEMKSSNARELLQGHRRVQQSFDLLLASVVSFGVVVLAGLVLIGPHWRPLYYLQLIALFVGVCATVTAILMIGLLMRSVRSK